MLMKNLMYLGIFLLVMLLNACGQPSQAPCSGQNNKCSNVTGSISTQPNDVIQAIMNRRSIRKYRPLAIEKEKLEKVLECGINAPNGMYKQSWEIRVVNTPEIMSEIEKGYTTFQKNNGKKRITHPSFGAPCLIFIAHDTKYDLSQVDCGLLGGNMILAAQSMNLGTCCLGGLVRYMNSKDASAIYNRLEIPESYKLLYAIAMGYPDETPAAKPRDKNKIKFIH